MPDGTREGDIEYAQEVEQAALPVGLVLQDPEVQQGGLMLVQKWLSAWKTWHLDPAAMPERVAAAAAAVGLEKPLDFPVDKLSMGQKYRLLVAALLVMESRLLILDEPGAQLDPAGLLQLQAVLEVVEKDRGRDHALRTPPRTLTGGH